MEPTARECFFPPISFVVHTPTESRMISMRLSDREYSELKKRYVALGDLNLSEFIRAAMVHALGSQQSSTPRRMWN